MDCAPPPYSPAFIPKFKTSSFNDKQYFQLLKDAQPELAIFETERRILNNALGAELSSIMSSRNKNSSKYLKASFQPVQESMNQHSITSSLLALAITESLAVIIVLAEERKDNDAVPLAQLREMVISRFSAEVIERSNGLIDLNEGVFQFKWEGISRERRVEEMLNGLLHSKRPIWWKIKPVHFWSR